MKNGMYKNPKASITLNGFPPNIRNNTKITALITFIQQKQVPVSAIRPGIKVFLIGKEEVKPSLLRDNMTINVENSMDFAQKKKLLEFINSFIKVA